MKSTFIKVVFSQLLSGKVSVNFEISRTHGRFALHSAVHQVQYPRPCYKQLSFVVRESAKIFLNGISQQTLRIETPLEVYTLV